MRSTIKGIRRHSLLIHITYCGRVTFPLPRYLYAQIYILKRESTPLRACSRTCTRTRIYCFKLCKQGSGLKKGRGAKIVEFDRVQALQIVVIAGSSSGRMRPSGGRHLGSNPSPAAQLDVLHKRRPYQTENVRYILAFCRPRRSSEVKS